MSESDPVSQPPVRRAPKPPPKFRLMLEVDGQLPPARPPMDRGHDDLASAKAKARRLVRNYPPSGGCFAEPDKNTLAVIVQKKQKTGWQSVARYKFVAASTRTGLTLKVVEETISPKTANG